MWANSTGKVFRIFQQIEQTKIINNITKVLRFPGPWLIYSPGCLLLSTVTILYYLPGSCNNCLLLFSRSVMSDSLRPHGLQQARLPCPSLSPRACSNSCPLSQWCHPTISSSVVPFSSCLQSFPTSGSFPMSQLFTWGGQSIGASASASVLSMNIQGWFPLGLTSLISWLSKELSRVLFSTTVQRHQFFGAQSFF